MSRRAWLAIASVFAFVSVARAQEVPELPPARPQIPSIARPTLVDSSGMRCPPGSHAEVHPQMGGCVPDCPSGYHPRNSTDPDACVKGNNSCTVISPLWPIGRPTHNFGWQALLCDAKPVVKVKVDPVYPADSIRDHEEGTAEFIIVGHDDGKVEIMPSPRWTSLRLQRAAQAALQPWQWRPYRLEGHPIEFRTTVYFVFKISPGGPRVQTSLKKQLEKSPKQA